MRALAASLALLPLPVLAQPLSLSDMAAVQTRYGLVSVAPSGAFEKGLYLNGTGQPLLTDRYLSILGAFALQGEDFDWVLVEGSGGGNACIGYNMLLRMAPGQVTRTDTFGPCLGGIEEVRLEPGRIVVDFDVPDLSVALERYVFDGATLTQTDIAADRTPVAPAGAGADVTRWVNRHPVELFHDRGEQTRFGSIMSLDQFNDLMFLMDVGDRAELRGGWVFGAGCTPHQCNSSSGFWGLRIADGAPVAAHFSSDGPSHWYGRPEVLADPAVAAFAAEVVPR